MMSKRRQVQVPGPLAVHAAGFGRALAAEGYVSGSARHQLWRMAELSRWMEVHGLAVADLTPGVLERFLAARRQEHPTVPSPRGMSHVVAYLRKVGAAPGAPAVAVVPGTPVEALMMRYATYLVGSVGWSRRPPLTT